MPFLAAETTKQIRKDLKKEFPKVKFSVKTKHNSTLDITILAAPIDFKSLSLIDRCGYWGVNEFNVSEEWKGEAEEFLTKMLAVVQGSHEQKEIVYDYDYGSVPNYYINARVGTWDKPFIFKAA